MLFDCNVARLIWFGSSTGLRIGSHNHREVAEWILEWVTKPHLSHKETMALFLLHAVTAWEIWKRRNRLVFQSYAPPLIPWLTSVNRMATTICDHYYPTSHQEESPHGIDQVHSGISRSSIGTDFEACVFTDVAVGNSPPAMALGCLGVSANFRLWWVATNMVHQTSVLGGEALAVRHGLQVALDMGLKRVHFFSDSLSLVHCLTGDQAHPTLPATTVISDIKCLQARFDKCVFHFVHRAFNVFAHSIAHWALYAAGNGFWVTPFPGAVQTLVNSFIFPFVDE